MIEQYERLELLIGKENLKKLEDKKVLVFGLGGVGGYIVDALARSGIMHFTLVDNDSFNPSNLNRQLLANLNTVGRLKTEVTKQHLLSLNPNIEVKLINTFYLPESRDVNFEGYDYVIDAIDTVTSKIDIIVKCYQLGIKQISALGCGNRLDPSKVVVTDLFKTKNDPLAKVLRKELNLRGIKHLKAVYSEELPIIKKTNKSSLPSSVFVPSVAGITIAYEVIKDLLK